MSAGQGVEETEQTARRAEGNPVVQGVARAGFVASGLVQAIIGVVAIEVGLAASRSAPDQTGALHDLAGTPGGPALLWATAVASFALAAWLVVSGLVTRRTEARERWKERAREWGRALVYLVIGVEAVRVVLGAGASSARTSREGSKDLLAVPGGPVVLVLLGAGVLIGGGALVWLGLAKRFTKLLRVPRGAAGTLLVLIGQVGYTARGIAIGIVGVLFAVAGFTLDPKKASGLDGALKALAAVPAGRVLLVAIGVGWIASGVFTALRARFARLD